MGLPIPEVAGKVATPNVFSESSAVAFNEGSSCTVEDMVFFVNVLGSGTGSPGWRLTGLPVPELAGIGLTLKSDASFKPGVSGKVPGRLEEPGLAALSRSDSFGTWPANWAVVDCGVILDIM